WSRRRVDPLFEPLAWFEGEHLARGDLDRFAGLGIPPAPRCLATDAEMTEADDLHVLALLEAAKDDVEDRLYHRRRLPLREPVVGHGIDYIVLRHGWKSPPPGDAARGAHASPAVTARLAR